jgi:hypothetical protein
LFGGCKFDSLFTLVTGHVFFQTSVLRSTQPHGVSGGARRACFCMCAMDFGGPLSPPSLPPSLLPVAQGIATCREGHSQRGSLLPKPSLGWSMILTEPPSLSPSHAGILMQRGKTDVKARPSHKGDGEDKEGGGGGGSGGGRKKRMTSVLCTSLGRRHFHTSCPLRMRCFPSHPAPFKSRDPGSTKPPSSASVLPPIK